MEVPESIEADVSRMEMGDALRLEDLPKIEGVTFLDDPHETVIATVSAPIAEVEPEPEEGEELEEGEEGEVAEGEAAEGEAAEGGAPEGDAQAESGSDGELRAASTRAAPASLPSGGEALDARSPRRRSRQPGPRARTRPAQRRLDGRRRARAASRRLVQVEVLRPARRGPGRRPEARAAEAGDVHEPVRQLARRRCALLQAPARADRRRPRRGRPRRRAGIQVRLGGGLAGHNGLRSIRQALGSAEFLRVRVGVGRPGRGDRRPVADYVLSPFAPEDDGDALVAAPPTRSRRWRAKGSTRLSAASTRGFGGMSLGARGALGVPRQGRRGVADSLRAIGATEDAASGRPARPGDSADISPNPPSCCERR